MAKFKIVFQPSGRRGEFDGELTILDAAKSLGVPLESLCGGEGWCGRCKVIVEKGSENLSPLTTEEKKLLSDEELSLNYRLACRAELRGDVVVSVPEVSVARVQVVRKPLLEIPVELKPALKKYYVELPPPTLQDPTGDLERLLKTLEETHGLKNLKVDYPVLKGLSKALRDGEWKATVTVWCGSEIVKVEPGRSERLYGVAIDVGTTTMVGYLLDLTTGKLAAYHSLMNPQVPFGEDVMSRITYVMDNSDGLERLHQKVISGINSITESLAKQAGVSLSDLYEVVLVGNTCMHHLLLKLSPEHLGCSPFPPTLHQPVDVKARELGVRILPSGNLHVLPIEAGFVGADNVGVLIAVEPWKSEEVQLIIDIGTNGEIVLGNKDRILSASCATGPAFEGAHIKYGMRAAPGAIEKVKIDAESLDVEYETIGGEKPRGICGSGIIQVTAEMFKAGVILHTGSFNKQLETPRIRKTSEGYEFVLAWKDETAVGADIAVTQKDIRAIQLAKAAMYAGAKVLMKRFGADHVEQVILAGAFGTYIDKEAAMVIGMFPDCPLEKVSSVGNAAGEGARLALLNLSKREEAKWIAEKVHYVEIAVDPHFQDEFVAAMMFPHQKDSFPHVEHLLPKEES
ncbi:MAG: ASKHA domain-containing protein [Candidatus Hecatellaceae archaeon]|nr:MAG: ferredoxin [Candidatus Hecatellales archaeon]